MPRPSDRQLPRGLRPEEGGNWLSSGLLVCCAKKRHELGPFTAIEAPIGHSGQGVGALVGGGQPLSCLPGDGRERRTPAVRGGFGRASASEDRLQRRQPVGSDGEQVPGAAVFTQPKQAKTHLVGGRLSAGSGRARQAANRGRPLASAAATTRLMRLAR